jgi:phosphoglycolate phosphatase
MKNAAIRGIIFDMDNTLLRSKIDFTGMKMELIDFLTSLGLWTETVRPERHTSSTIMAVALETGRMTEQEQRRMWEICERHERQGMAGADLEPGVPELLQELHGSYVLTVLTNNSIHAAEPALRENGIASYFDLVVGREMVASLKPSPDGVLYILQQYRSIEADQWISVGDSWIDGKASMEAGVSFIAYQGDREKMKRAGVEPVAEISNIRELAKLLSL